MISTGKRVVVIHSDQEYNAGDTRFPPLGTMGTCMTEIDNWGEYDIFFDNIFCPTPPDPYWVTHKTMIAFLKEDGHTETEQHMSRKGQNPNVVTVHE